MKKILGVMLAFALLLSSMTVFAQTPIEEYNNAWSQKYLSGTLDYSISTKLNTPLSAYLDPDGTISEALNKAKINYNMNYETNENQDAIKAYMLVSIDSFAKDMPNIKMQTWLDMDLSDENNMKYDIIMKYIEPKDQLGQMADKYLVMDYTKIPGMMDMLKSMKSIGMFDVTKMQEVQSAMMAGITEKITPIFKEGVFTLNLDEKTVKDVLQAVSINLFDTYTKYLIEQFTTGSISQLLMPAGSTDEAPQMSDEDIAQAKKAMADFFEKIADVQILDPKNAIQLETTLDDNKLLKTVKYTINLNTNIAKIAGVFNIPETDKNLTDQNSNINGAIIFDLKYDKTNQPVEITFPEITAENSINMLDMMNSSVNPYGDGVTVLYNGDKIEYDNSPVTWEDGVLVPLRQTLNALGIQNENIFYEDGNITIITLDKVIKLAIDSDTIYVNDETVLCKPEPKLINDTTYVSDTFLMKALDLNLSMSTFTGNEKNTSYLVDITD